MKLIVVIVFFLASIIGLFVALIIIQRKSLFLRRLNSAMERVLKGDFTTPLPPEKNREIREVVTNYNRMAADIRKAREVTENLAHWLERKVKERTEELRVLINVSKAIVSTLDLELLIGNTIRQIQPILHADVYVLFTPEEKGDFSVRAVGGCARETFNPRLEIGKGAGLLDEACNNNEVVYAENVPSDPRCQDTFFKELGLKTAIAVALRNKGKIKGLLLLGTLKEHKYSEEREINLLANVSDQLAVAMENVDIFEKEREAVTRLTEVDRLKSNFISMVSHELRTPVTSADGYVSLFLAGVTGALTEDQKKYLGIVRENNQRLLTLINRLLDFSSMETGRFSIKRELCSMDDIIRKSAAAAKGQVEKKKGKLILSLAARNDKFMGDAEKMGEAVAQLVENALKFCREGVAPVLEISTRNSGDFIEIIVADNGLGIESDHLEKIFNKYYQAEDTLTRKVGGLGLGLTIAKEIIGSHHGKLWAESEGVNKGASFIVAVPVAEKR